VRARTITLKLKLARPLGGGRYPLLTRSSSLDSATDDTSTIAHHALAILARVSDATNFRLAGVQAHNLERVDTAQMGLFDGSREPASKSARLNRAMDRVTQRFGEDAIARGMVKATCAAPTRRIK
jgi:hypothetical protein